MIRLIPNHVIHKSFEPTVGLTYIVLICYFSYLILASANFISPLFFLFIYK